MIYGRRTRTRMSARWRHLWRGIDGVSEMLLWNRVAVPDILRDFGAEVGPGAQLQGSLHIVNAVDSYRNLTIGPSAHVGLGVVLDLTGQVEIGELAVLSMRCIVLTHQDVGGSALKSQMPRRIARTTVKEGAYVGAGAILMPGVTIGREAVVAAGAVVLDDVPSRARVVGVPARELHKGE